MAQFSMEIMRLTGSVLRGNQQPSSYYDRVVDVCEELVKFTVLTRDASAYLTDRYSERKEQAAELEKRVSLRSI